MNTSLNMRWRLSLFVLALVLVTSVPLFSVSAAPSDTVTITTFPNDYQLYARDNANKGTVTVEGSIVSASTSQVRVDVMRNGVAYGSQSATLNYSGDTADFSVDVSIDAELADYTIQLFTVDGGVDALQATADYIVAGDVYVVQGQSNAVAGMYSTDDDEDPDNNADHPTVFSSASAQNDYVRTYNSGTADLSVLQLDDNWYIADGDGFNDAGAIGQWPLKMADTLVDEYSVPVAVINGAFGGEAIAFFQRNDDDPTDITSNYGRLLYRLQRAGLQNDVKALFWYQGENDAEDVEGHVAGFDAIYKDWATDYPSVDNIYVFQLAHECFIGNEAVREAQRSFPTLYDNLTVISTNNIKGHRADCHYWWQNGYETLGENAARMLAAEYYGGEATDVNSPDLVRAYYSTPEAGYAEKTRVTLQLNNVANGFFFDEYRPPVTENYHTALLRFSVGSDADEYVSINGYELDQANGQIIFDIQTDWDANGPVPPTGNIQVHFEGDSVFKIGTLEADQDNVSNSNGLGLLSFTASVFESADAPEAIIYPEDGYSAIGTLNNGSFSVSLKGDRSNDPNNDINQHRWDFGDGSGFGFGTNEFHSFTAPGAYEVTLRVRDQQGNFGYATQTVLVFADTADSCVTHGLNYERFDSISGTAISDLTGAVDLMTAAASTHSYIENFEIPSNIGDEYGARVRGYIVAPISGDYEFWVASDDESQVYLYTMEDADAAGFTLPTIAETIANDPTIHITGNHSQPREFEGSYKAVHGSSYTQWDQFTAPSYFTRTLEVGKKYYVEALFKEGASGGDHLSLGWRLPGATDYTLIEENNLCVATTSLPLAPLPIIDAKPFGEESGTEATGAAPLIIDFSANGSRDDDGDINEASFTWSFGDGNVNPSSTQATAYEYSTPGTYYAVLSVTDEQGFTNNAVEKIEVLEPDCSVDGNGILFERFDNIGGLLISDMLSDDNYTSNAPTFKSRLNTFEIPTDVGDEYAARIRGYIVPDQTGTHMLRIASDDQAVVFLSTDADPANMTPIMAVTNYTGTLSFDPVTGIPGTQGYTPERDWLNTDVKYTHQQSAGIEMTAGQRYYVEVLYKEELFGDHLSIGWQEPGSQSYDLILCNNLEPYNDAIHNLDIQVTASQTSVPESGAWIEYEVILSNTSSDELGIDPIQIELIVDSKHGEVASTAFGWATPFVENTCWWWIPELWNGQEWRCTYSRWVTGEGQVHDVTVTGTSQSGKTISEVATVDHIAEDGPGVKTTAAWAADGIEVIEQVSQMVDTDGDMDLNFDTSDVDVRDTEGILIGDFDLDGVCDMWQTWWLRNCIALSSSEVMSVLDDDASTDMRDKMLRSMTATWLNIAAGNSYECADMQTAINLGLIWMNDHGNPLEGGNAVSAISYDWTQIEYAQVWFDWYNDTGGNECGVIVDGSVSNCGGLAQNAEFAGEDSSNPTAGTNSIYGDRIEVVSDSDASSGAYIRGRTDASSQWNMTSRTLNGETLYSSDHRAEYCVTVPADGYYTIDAWIRTPSSGRDNSFFVQFNDGGYALWDTAKNTNSFIQDEVNHRGWNNNTAVWYLTEGEHTLKFHLRENGTQLDHFVVQPYGARNEPQTIDAGTPLGNAYFSTGATSDSTGHYMYEWLVDGNNVDAGSRSGNHTGEFATALAGFVTDVDGLTAQDSVDVSGAVGWIGGSVDVAADTDEIVHVAGVNNFAPESQVVPTAVAVSGSATNTTPAVWQLVALMMSIVTLGAMTLRKRTD